MFEEGKTYKNPQYSATVEFRCVLANKKYAVLEFRRLKCNNTDFWAVTREHFKNFQEVVTPDIVYVGYSGECPHYAFKSEDSAAKWVNLVGGRSYAKFVEVLEDG